MPRFSTLTDWLAWQETLHPRKIDLGLERVAQVAERMQLLTPGHGVITVAGTNGKGSSVAMLESILSAAGYRIACYTSPHLLRYNERIRIAGKAVDDATLCAAFDSVDQARGNISLSYFEFGTLAALSLFSQAHLDIALLEVGMGGRLDAVNILDGDAALVTSIDIDHSTWLGKDRETIGREKAGIFRADRPAVCSDPAPPASVRRQAQAVSARWYAPGCGFDWTTSEAGWNWQSSGKVYRDLPLPALPGSHQLQNAAGVLMVLEALASRFPLSRSAIEKGLLTVTIAGRCQLIPGAVETLLDVAHNPGSAESLAQLLRQRDVRGRTRTVLGMLADKDVAAFAAILNPVVDDWYLASLPGERGLTAEQLQQSLCGNVRTAPVQLFQDVATAFSQARADAKAGDRVVVCGSFVTVAEALVWCNG
ncbi:MAG: bifunctional tetrahydrofolate synthase/dihydrofolate synthase [Gammaproteobacteria bacterium]